MYAQVEKPKNNKSRAVANSVTKKKSNGKQVFGFVDNRSEAVAQRKNKELSKFDMSQKFAIPALNITPCHNAFPVQRIISYKKGQYKSRKQLVDALISLFGSNAVKKIEDWVTQYESSEAGTRFASTVFREIESKLRTEGYEGTRGVEIRGPTSTHGPQLPTRPNRDAADDLSRAMSSFRTGSCTLGRLTIFYELRSILFHDRQRDKNFHAEDGLIEQLTRFANAHTDIDWTRARINLTINNFFCSEHTTSKSSAEKNCLDQIVALQALFKFGRFHVYFKNAYGDRKYMESSIAKLQSAGILITPFALAGESVKYASKTVDPQSDSDDEDFAEFDQGDRKSAYRKSSEIERLDIHEQRFLAALLEINNCLINAVARPGLGRNANLEELVLIRLALQERGLGIGEMLVASPAVLNIIRDVLGVHRGIVVHYQGVEQPSDIVDGPNCIVIDHRDEHFQERRILRARRRL